MNFLTRTIPALILFNLFAGYQVGALAQDQSNQLPSDEYVRGINENDNLTDSEKLDQFARLLGKFIMASRMTTNTAAANRCSSLLFRLANPSKQGQETNRINSLKKYIDSKNGDTNSAELVAYLNIALALAGAHSSETNLVALLSDRSTPKEIILCILKGMSRTSVPVVAVPRIKELAGHPWNCVLVNDVGPQHPERIYPIRDAAYDCLMKAGIHVRKVFDEDQTPDPEWGIKLRTTTVKID